MSKKYRTLKTAHMLLIIAGIVVYACALIKYSDSISRITSVCYITNILALSLGFVYLIMNYRKDAATYYKAFMWLVVISEMIESVSILSSYTPTVADIFKNNINLVLFTLIAGAKNYGKNNSKLLAIVLVIFNVYAIIDITTMNGIAGFAIMDRIGQLIIAIATSAMIYGKYLDKELRKAD